MTFSIFCIVNARLFNFADKCKWHGISVRNRGYKVTSYKCCIRFAVYFGNGSFFKWDTGVATSVVDRCRGEKPDMCRMMVAADKQSCTGIDIEII